MRLTIVMLAAMVVLSGCADDGSSSGSGGHPDGRTGPAASGPVAHAKPAPTPAGPPARICGAGALRGPAKPPSGATTVSTSQDLSSVVSRAPAGTTFWLEPGTHRLGAGTYSQVIPKNGDRFVGAPAAVLDGGQRNRYAFGGHASDVTISHLTVQNFGGTTDNLNEGVVNHDAGARWEVLHNTVRHNGGAGVFLGSGNVLRDNCLTDNGQYGFSAYAKQGVEELLISHNEISRNNTADWERLRPGCGCTGGGKFWDVRDAVIERNWIHDNRGAGIWADTNNTEFLIQGNYIADNDTYAVIYEISYNARIVHNVFVHNGTIVGPTNPGFPTAAVYLSESGADRRAGATYGDVLEVGHNRFVDNWSGVVAWENADRFAGSPANTSTGYTTLVSPKKATLRACGTPGLIGKKPYVDDCRWKTQHVRVTHNEFVFHPDRVGKGCSEKSGCGFVGLFSNFGSYPDWSPYKGTVVEKQVALEQDNRWSDNAYEGPWRFMAMEQGKPLSWDDWRDEPYRQDAGSTLQTQPD